MDQTSQELGNIEKYDVFISYSMDPDYFLSKRIENYLECFHKRKVSGEIQLKTIQVCRDGSDFSLHKLKKENSGNSIPEEPIQQVLVEYLRNSEYLLLLCSGKAAKSKFVQFEVEWFIQNKGTDKILIAVTEGSEPTVDVEEKFPKSILLHQLHNQIYYDFRGYKKPSKNWVKVRDFKEELTKIAAHLNGYSPGKILPMWRHEETQKLKRQRYASFIVAAIFMLISVLAFFQWKEAVKNRNIAVRNEKIAQKNLHDFKVEQYRRHMRNGIVYFEAKEFKFAQKEFLEARSILNEYPKDSLLLTQKSSLLSYLNKCQTETTYAKNF